MKTCITKGIVTVSLTAILLSCSSTWAAGKGGLDLQQHVLFIRKVKSKFHWVYVTPVRMFLIWFSHGWWPQIIKISGLYYYTTAICAESGKRESVTHYVHWRAVGERQRNSFFTSVRAVPSTTKREEGNTLKIATQSVIKLFWRPKGLAYPFRRGSGETALHFVSWHGYGQ